MRNVLILCILLISLIGCSSTGGVSYMSSEENALSLLNLNSHPANVYVGISGPYSTQERMVEAAILACAKNILLERALAMDNTLVMQGSSTQGLLSFAQKENAYYDDNSLKEIIQALEVLSVTFDEHAGSIVLARYPDSFHAKRNYKVTFDPDGKPDWLVQLPQVDGYRFGIGCSKSYYFLNDSLEASDFSAAQNLLDFNTEHVFSKSLSITRDGSVSSMDNVLYQAQRGLLLGFTIVDRYYEKESDTYWSLASIIE